MKIYLIGMPGSGKTTLGKQLAEALWLPFIDLDIEIEKRVGKSIKEIFIQNGEDHFRIIESQLLKEFASSADNYVMATGGGAPCFHNGIEVINLNGLSIFLDVSVAELLRRVALHTNRPLLDTNDQTEKEVRLHALRENRLPYYSQGKIRISSPDLTKLLTVLRLHINK